MLAHALNVTRSGHSEDQIATVAPTVYVNLSMSWCDELLVVMRHNKSSSDPSDGEFALLLSIDYVQGGPKQAQTAIGPTPPTPAAKSIFRRVCASAMIAISLAITVTWIFLLGYALITLIQLAI